MEIEDWTDSWTDTEGDAYSREEVMPDAETSARDETRPLSDVTPPGAGEEEPASGECERCGGTKVVPDEGRQSEKHGAWLTRPCPDCEEADVGSAKSDSVSRRLVDGDASPGEEVLTEEEEWARDLAEAVTVADLMDISDPAEALEVQQALRILAAMPHRTLRRKLEEAEKWRDYYGGCLRAATEKLAETEERLREAERERERLREAVSEAVDDLCSLAETCSRNFVVEGDPVRDLIWDISEKLERRALTEEEGEDG